jgi:hypothetical protein
MKEQLDILDRRRQILLMALAIAGLLGIGALFVALYLNRLDDEATHFIEQNWRVILGVPFSCIGSFIVVALFRQNAGPIEFEGIGFKFKGSAGEIVLWAMCYIILIGSIKLLS